MRLFSFSDRLNYKISRKDVQGTILELEKDLRSRVGNSTDEELDPTKDFSPFQKEVEEFVKIFRETFPLAQTQAMLYRLNRLEIEVVKKTIGDSQKVTRIGGYNSFRNKLTVYDIDCDRVPDEKRETIFHELLHMASSKALMEGSISGFDVKTGKNLNEGYTEVLRKRYFCNSGRKEWNEVIAEGIENIVGRQKMERYYLNADLPALIHELSNYMEKEDVYKLLYIMDNTEEIRGEEVIQKFSRKKYNILIQEIANANLRKLNHMLRNKCISEEEYLRQKEIKVDSYREQEMKRESSKTYQKRKKQQPTLAYANPAREIEIKK